MRAPLYRAAGIIKLQGLAVALCPHPKRAAHVTFGVPCNKQLLKLIQINQNGLVIATERQLGCGRLEQHAVARPRIDADDAHAVHFFERGNRAC